MKAIKAITGIGFIVAVLWFTISLLISFIKGVPGAYPSDNSIDLENFSISDLSEDQIVNTVSQFRGGWTTSHKYGEQSGVQTKRYFGSDRDGVDISHKKATGITTVCSTRIENATVRITVDAEVVSGEMRMVVVDSEGALEWIELKDHFVLEFSADETKEYYIKILCEDANIRLNIAREVIPE